MVAQSTASNHTIGSARRNSRGPAVTARREHVIGRSPLPSSASMHEDGPVDEAGIARGLWSYSRYAGVTVAKDTAVRSVSDRWVTPTAPAERILEKVMKCRAVSESLH